MTPEEFKAARERLRLSKKDLAATLELSRDSIWQLETGRRAITKPIEFSMLWLQQVQLEKLQEVTKR